MNDKIEKQQRYVNRIPVDNITALRVILGKDPNDYVILLGKDNKGDGDAREYYWDVISLEDDDGDFVILPTIIESYNPGRWIKVVNTASGGDGTFKGVNYLITGQDQASSFYAPHNWNTTDVITQVYAIADGEVVTTELQNADNGVNIKFLVPPENGEQFKVLMITF